MRNFLFDNMLMKRQHYYVGVPTTDFNNIYATQRNSMLCWAACIQMILRHHGISVSQMELAELICGTDYNGIPNNCPASLQVITNQLNNCWANYKEKYCLQAPITYGCPNLIALYEELKGGNPVVVTYTNPGASIGHAVLITGIEYYFLGDTIYVSKFILRDPWPSSHNIMNHGRVVKSNALDFANSITAHWFVELKKEEYSYNNLNVWNFHQQPNTFNFY